jgi:hypothetical protein
MTHNLRLKFGLSQGVRLRPGAVATNILKQHR